MDKLPSISQESLLASLSRSGLETGLVSKAIAIATLAHLEQVRDSGTSYLEEHVYYVADLVLKLFPNADNLEDLIVVALLHDVLEDSTLYTPEMLTEAFGAGIVQAIELLTKTKDENAEGGTQQTKYEANKNYLLRLAKNPLAVQVKLVDRLANLHSITGHNILLKPEKYKRYLQETRNLFIPLAETNNLPGVTALLAKEVERVSALLDSH